MEKAELYVKLGKLFSKNAMLAQLLKEHESLLSWGPDEVVLDAGCGPGDVTADVLLPWLPPDCQAVMGVDISPAMIHYALENYAAGKLSFTKMDICGDISNLNNVFDKIFSFYVLHWLSDLKKGLSNLNAALKPGGQGLFAFHFDHSYFKTYIRISAKEPWRRYFKDIKRNLCSFPSEADAGKEFNRMLLEAGFKVEKCEVSKVFLHFDSMEIFYGVVEVLDVFVDCIPVNLRRKYLTDCVHDMRDLGLLKVEEDRVLLQQSFLVAVVRKCDTDRQLS